MAVDLETVAGKPPEPILRLLRNGPPELLAHSLATARLVERMLPLLPRDGLPARDLLLGALAHDAGKAFWPEKLFTKRFLTEAERCLVWAHPIIGADLLRKKWPGAPEGVIGIVLEHHERPGGNGYPRQIEPTYPALVVAAADVLAAMTTDRAYRPTLPLDKALEEIAKWAPPELLAAVEAAAIEMRQKKPQSRNQVLSLST